MSEDFKDKFPEKWLCPYCVTEVTDEKRAIVDKCDIPTHLVHKHDWDGEILTWKNIFERVAAVGGI